MALKPDLRAILQMLGIDPDTYERYHNDHFPNSVRAENPAEIADNPVEPTSGQIEWNSTIPGKPRKNNGLVRIPPNRVDWGSSTLGIEDSAAALVGMEDAFDHTPLQPGEKVAFCTLDRIAYHLGTWRFLHSENGGRCCICGRSNVIRIIQLPVSGGAIAVPDSDSRAPVLTPVLDKSGLQIINLKDVHSYMSLAVVVQDYVHEVYQTRATGTFFIRFEPRDKNLPPFTGFKVVVFKKYLAAWEQLNISPRMYMGQTIRVRGLIQHHPDWGIEILVNSPRVIEIVPPADDPAEKGTS